MSASRVVVLPLISCLLLSTVSPASQTTKGKPLGALSAAGEVYLSNLPVTGESTIFVGESLSTGSDGAARVTVPGRGSLTVASQSRISFAPETRYFAALQYGSVGWRALAGAKDFQLRFGNFTVVPFGEGEGATVVELAAGGSAQVSCIAGSVGIIELEGPQAVFLVSGETATVSAQGLLRKDPPVEAEAAQNPPGAPVPAGRKRRKRGFFWIGLAGGGVAAAAALFAGGHHNAALPVSPSSP